MDSLKIGEMSAQAGKRPVTAPPAARTAPFDPASTSAQPATGLHGGTSADVTMRSGAVLAAQLAAPPAVSVSNLPASAAYGAARAALGVED